MIYILNLIITVGYSYFIKKNKILYFTPILLLWIIILGGQYEVGTDYRNYLNFFYGIRDIELFFLQKEYIFYYFMKLTSTIFSNGQIIFVIIGGIESIVFFWYIKKLEQIKLLNKEKVYMFIFLYLAYGTLFYNQMNTLRQSFTIYLFSLGILYTLKKELKKYFYINIIAIFIHRSAYILLPFYFFYHFLLKKINKKSFYIIIILISFIISLFDIVDIIKPFIIKYVPSFSVYFFIGQVEKVAFEKKILKYLYLPFYILSINLLEIKKNEEKEMLKIGIFAYSIRILTLNLNIITRMGDYFILLTIFPIYYLIENWLKRKQIFLLLIIFGMIISIFLLKVTIFASGEYYYRSYLFN